MVTPLPVAWVLSIRVEPDAPATEREDCTAATAAAELMERAEDDDETPAIMPAATVSEALGAASEVDSGVAFATFSLDGEGATGESCEDEGTHCSDVVDGGGGGVVVGSGVVLDALWPPSPLPLGGVVVGSRGTSEVVLGGGVSEVEDGPGFSCWLLSMSV